MKRVRFETPSKVLCRKMEEAECHFPRPYLEKQTSSNRDVMSERLLPFTKDPVQRYEISNSCPYPMAAKTQLYSNTDQCSKWLPSNELDLSMLDATNHEPRHISMSKPLFVPEDKASLTRNHSQVLSPIEINKMAIPPNVLSKDNGFFIRRDNLDNFQFDAYPLQNKFYKLNLGKENEPLSSKAEIIRKATEKTTTPEVPKLNNCSPYIFPNTAGNLDCSCHHCIKVMHYTRPSNTPQFQNLCQNVQNTSVARCCNQCSSVPPPPIKECFRCNQKIQVHKMCCCTKAVGDSTVPKHNAVDKKTWAIEKYEKESECLDIEKQTNIVKEKREPTVADLFKIIKLQNEQLQLLQEKVDKFISASNKSSQATHTDPPHNYTTEQVAAQTVDSEITQHHKISIGVMTSFEMVRTSTVINQEYVTQSKDNAQIQCNRSQISVKEVVSKTPTNLNFLEGILPVGKVVQTDIDTSTQETQVDETKNINVQSVNANDEKTLNDYSLYNVQVDNATTPLISPEQTMYLDVRDFSDSDSGSENQSNVGWTYYNKVMTHVNGLLQDSDMPSSASALYRNTRQQCVQMKIDKSNLSVTKRVKFGDDPFGIHQPHIYPTSDTSMKMNQLAAKYLKSTTTSLPKRLATKSSKPKTIDLSFSTRDYMEQHNLLQGLPNTRNSPHAGEMPRFLDNIF